MWEITLFDDGIEVGTWDYPIAPVVGTCYDDCVVVSIRDIDTECMMASVERLHPLPCLWPHGEYLGWAETYFGAVDYLNQP